MMHRIYSSFRLVLLPLIVLLFTACASEIEQNVEYEHWQERNDSYFRTIATLAKDSIHQAKLQYGEHWQQHCNWLALTSYLVPPEVATATDTVYVQRLIRSNHSYSPLSSDSISVQMRGRLMPSRSYPEGRIFMHTGLYNSFDRVFDIHTAGVQGYQVGKLVKGLETALLHMHLGDLWRVYVPYQLAYNEKTTVPAYSTLIFEVRPLQLLSPVKP